MREGKGKGKGRREEGREEGGGRWQNRLGTLQGERRRGL
jgi:hypothetical protein